MFNFFKKKKEEKKTTKDTFKKVNQTESLNFAKSLNTENGIQLY